MATDILFVNPGEQAAPYQHLSREYTAVAPPVWAALLARHAQREGLEVAIHDANVEGWDDETARKVLDKREPRLAVVLVSGHSPSASTQTMPAAGRIARDLKRLAPSLRIAMGGLHPSALPARTLREEAIDFVIEGEGVPTLVQLHAHLDGRLPAAKVPGLWFRDGDSPRGSPPATPAVPLDTMLPGCAWDLLPDLGHYRAHTMHCFQDFARSTREDFSDVRSPYATVWTSLGCPFSCAYCAIHALRGARAVRFWSVERVVSQLVDLAGRGVRTVRIEDELFLSAPSRVERLCDALIDRNLDLNLWVYGRVDTVPRPLLRKLRDAGITWICLGIESASRRVLADVGRGDRADAVEVVRSIQGEGISVLGNFLFGLPEDDRNSMQDTLRLALALRCEFANFYTVMAYPGSQLWERQGADVLPESWAGYAQLGYETKPLPTRHLPAREILRFRDEAFRSYFTDAGYLTMMGRKYGAGVVRHLEGMVALPLRRRLLGD